MLVVAGGLLVTSAVNADGTDLRAGRYTDLASLVSQEKQKADNARARANALAEEVNALSSQVKDDRVQQVTDASAALRMPAGLDPVHGPGLTVVLTDAPESVVDSVESSGETEVKNLFVHQQDIQAVANAMWAGGAEAMTIQNQRVISTTGIKCVGNTVRLHGYPYAPPYVITAVGDPTGMLAELSESPYLQIYRQYAVSYQLGYEVNVRQDVRLPGYEGSLELDYARPVGQQAQRPEDSEL
ncbi:MAG TPA: DUF881 domain-containing protein [Nocardioidaceae bacterium]|nr:DUF881 domain-containing protein [Nocardioidaceae bacterium]